MIGRRREQTASLALQTRESVSREGKFESCGEVEKGREHGGVESRISGGCGGSGGC